MILFPNPISLVIFLERERKSLRAQIFRKPKGVRVVLKRYSFDNMGWVRKEEEEEEKIHLSLLVDPVKGALLPLLHLTLLEPQGNLLLGVVDAVGAVADIATDILIKPRNH